jgi:hypothetical protein
MEETNNNTFIHFWRRLRQQEIFTAYNTNMAFSADPKYNLFKKREVMYLYNYYDVQFTIKLNSIISS